MSRTKIEIQSILSTLNFLYWRYTDPCTRITHKPHGIDWICVERSVYRLLVLRGTINMGEKVSGDPWDLYLNEYAPAGTRRSMSLGQVQGQGKIVQSPISMPSTTSASTTTASSEGQSRGRRPASCDGQQQQQQPQRRVRFLDTPSPARGRAPRRLPLSPAPNARFH